MDYEVTYFFFGLLIKLDYKMLWILPIIPKMQDCNCTMLHWINYAEITKNDFSNIVWEN